MASVQPDQTLLYPWDPHFQLRPRQDVGLEKPWIETSEAIDETGNCEDKTELYFDEADRDDCTLQDFREFCAGESLVDLRMDKSRSMITNVILDERDNSGKVLHNLKRLTANALYKYLRPDSEFTRRLVHVKNPKGRDLHAIMGTARLHELTALRETVPNYISQNSHMAVKISHEKQPTFTMCLNITFPVFKEAVEKCSNCLKQPDPEWKGLEPRELTPLPFLSNFFEITPTWVDCIIPQHSSILIRGRSAFQWTAYSMVDTKEDQRCPLCGKVEPDEDAEDEDEDEDDGLEGMDPLTLFTREAKGSFELQCRQYFLSTTRPRVQQAKKQWRNTVRHLQRRTSNYIKNHPLWLHDEQDEPPNKRSADERIRLAHNWVIETRNLLRELKSMLSNTVRAWERFVEDDKHYFNDLARNETEDLCVIGEHFKDMQGLLRDLEDLMDRSGDANKGFNLHLILVSRKSATTQERNAVFTNLMGLIALLFIPPTLTASLYNVPQGVIPGLENTFRSFVIICGVVFLVLFVLFMLLSHLEGTKQLLLALLGLPYETKKIGKHAKRALQWVSDTRQRWFGAPSANTTGDASNGAMELGTLLTQLEDRTALSNISSVDIADISTLDI